MATMRRGRSELADAPQREPQMLSCGGEWRSSGPDPRPWTPTKTELDVRDFLRYATRRRGFLVASLVVGFVVGVAYRGLVDAPEIPEFGELPSQRV